MWHTVTDHIEPVTLNGKVLYVLTDDKSGSYRRRSPSEGCTCSEDTIPI